MQLASLRRKFHSRLIWQDRNARVSTRFVAYTTLFCGILLCGRLMLPEVGSHGPPREVYENQQYLHHILLALHVYKVEKGEFPPVVWRSKPGNIPYSWRVALLPYLERQLPDEFSGATEVYNQYHFDEPWNSDHNRQLAQRSRNFYATSEFKDRGNCLAVVGANGEFNSDVAAFCGEYDSSPLTHAVIVAQVLDSNIHWMKPKDLTVAELQAVVSKELRSLKPKRQFDNLGMSDGCTYSMRDIQVCEPAEK